MFMATSLRLMAQMCNKLTLPCLVKRAACTSTHLSSQLPSKTGKQQTTFTKYFAKKRAVQVLESISDASEMETAEKGDIEVYTDGSTVKFGSGCAFVVTTPDHQVEMMFKTVTKATNNQLELLAIEKALNHVSKMNLNQEKPVKVIINTDSQVSIYRVTNENNKNACALRIRSEIEKLRRQRVNVAMRFIKAHVGIPGNELANSLAHRAVEEGATVEGVD